MRSFLRLLFTPSGLAVAAAGTAASAAIVGASTSNHKTDDKAANVFLTALPATIVLGAIGVKRSPTLFGKIVGGTMAVAGTGFVSALAYDVSVNG